MNKFPDQWTVRTRESTTGSVGPYAEPRTLIYAVESILGVFNGSASGAGSFSGKIIYPGTFSGSSSGKGQFAGTQIIEDPPDLTVTIAQSTATLNWNESLMFT